MPRGHRPNCKKDTRKPRVKEGICSISHCSRPSGVTYYGWPLCDVCFNYYADLETDTLKRILGIRERKSKSTLDTFEEEMFNAD
jgi:hypothetical protein